MLVPTTWKLEKEWTKKTFVFINLLKTSYPWILVNLTVSIPEIKRLELPRKSGHIGACEKVSCRWKVTQQEGPLTISQADDPPGEKADKSDFCPNLAYQRIIWLPRLHARMIRPQNICNQQGVAGIIAGSALSEPPTRTSYLAGMEDIQLGVSLIPQKIKQNIVSGL